MEWNKERKWKLSLCLHNGWCCLQLPLGVKESKRKSEPFRFVLLYFLLIKTHHTTSTVPTNEKERKSLLTVNILLLHRLRRCKNSSKFLILKSGEINQWASDSIRRMMMDFFLSILASLWEIVFKERKHLPLSQFVAVACFCAGEGFMSFWIIGVSKSIKSWTVFCTLWNIYQEK